MREKVKLKGYLFGIFCILFIFSNSFVSAGGYWDNSYGFLPEDVDSYCGERPILSHIIGPAKDTFLVDDPVITLNAKVNGGTPPYTYFWFNSENVILQESTSPTLTIPLRNIAEIYDPRSPPTIYLIVVDSKKICAAHESLGRGIDDILFAWGIEISAEDYSIENEKERLLNCIHYSTIPEYPWNSISHTQSGVCPDTDSGNTVGHTSSPIITLKPVDHINPNPPPDDGDGGWILVVGGLTALTAAAIAAIRKMQSKPKKEGEKSRTTNILQLSKNEVSVSTKKTDSFYAKAWIVDETGQYTPASSALLSVSVSSPVDGLAFSPASGMGEISVTISLSKPINVKTATLNVKGQVGLSSISGSVTVHIEPELQVGFE